VLQKKQFQLRCRERGVILVDGDFFGIFIVNSINRRRLYPDIFKLIDQSKGTFHKTGAGLFAALQTEKRDQSRKQKPFYFFIFQ
jgi:hypothetical protein